MMNICKQNIQIYSLWLAKDVSIIFTILCANMLKCLLSS